MPDADTFDGLIEVAKRIMRARAFLPRHYDSPEKVALTLLAAKQLQIPGTEALKQIYVIDGRTGMSSHLMNFLLRRAGIRIRVEVNTARECKMVFIRPYPDGTTDEHVETYSWEDATRAGLSKKQNYIQHPKMMLRARCMGNGARFIGADLLGGAVYTMETAPDGTPIGEFEEVQPQAQEVDVEVTDTECGEPEKTDDPPPANPQGRPKPKKKADEPPAEDHKTPSMFDEPDVKVDEPIARSLAAKILEKTKEASLLDGFDALLRKKYGVEDVMDLAQDEGTELHKLLTKSLKTGDFGWYDEAMRED